MTHAYYFIMSVLMSLTKKAKTLTKPLIKPITGLIWKMVTDADGQLSSAIHLRNEASRGRSGRIIPLNKELRGVLEQPQRDQSLSPFVITTASRAPPSARRARSPVAILSS